MTTTSVNPILVIASNPSGTSFHRSMLMADMLEKWKSLGFIAVEQTEVRLNIDGHSFDKMYIDEYKPLEEPKVKKAKPYWRKNERW